MKKAILLVIPLLSVILISCKEVKVGGITIFDPHGLEKAVKGLKDMSTAKELEDDVAWCVAYNGRDCEKTKDGVKAKGKFLKYDDFGCAIVRVETLIYDENLKIYKPFQMERKRVCLGN